MKLLFISIEFSAATFSGNGIYCRSQVRALSQHHEVLVICGKPAGYSELRVLEGAVDLLEVELPSWGQLDAGCSWQQFAAGAACTSIAQRVARFAPEAVLGVDWHSLAAYESLAAALAALPHTAAVAGPGAELPPAAAAAAAAPQQPYVLAPYVFLNYRVYMRSGSEADAALLKDLERRALQRSVCTTVLSRSDADFLKEAFPEATLKKPLRVLLPALRADMAALPLPADSIWELPMVSDRYKVSLDDPRCVSDASQTTKGEPMQQAAEVPSNGELASQQQPPEQEKQHQGKQVQLQGTLSAPSTALPATLQGIVDPGRGRYLLTCAVRISPEKEPGRFVDLTVQLARTGALERCGAVPLMFGAGWVSEYGQALKKKVKEELPQCIILESFLGPAELAAIYSLTLLNIHPCLYDAYGMTIVEAASQGAPSLVNHGGQVGATDLLDRSASEIICMDLSLPATQLAAQVEPWLEKGTSLRYVGDVAARKARSWTEEANADCLVKLVKEALQEHAAGKENTA